MVAVAQHRQQFAEHVDRVHGLGIRSQAEQVGFDHGAGDHGYLVGEPLPVPRLVERFHEREHANHQVGAQADELRPDAADRRDDLPRFGIGQEHIRRGTVGIGAPHQAQRGDHAQRHGRPRTAELRPPRPVDALGNSAGVPLRLARPRHSLHHTPLVRDYR
ncbi:hypothetical protein HDA32_005816 [Spinactinospora alkalitolerans]|uniref:Uncharacterized protein n=1 Tax=Spinactinospora alkalitolerans TaxID=687207 RepID=A0A852U1G2_9ACTN|nr:hypothetical protein [Spinactinospora alkalitolerans]NYE50696.1 hypothetical protein [Spinactinospora alkalitolerans]